MESPRLGMIMGLVPTEGVVADIGTDHALVPIALRERGQRVIATELGEGPLAVSRQAIEGYGTNGIELRQGDGLRPLSPGEADTIVIAGMGGDRVCRLLAEAPEVVQSTSALVLSPNTRVDGLRRFIAAQGWALGDERIADEDGKFYVAVLVHPRGRATHRWAEADFELGPILRHRGGPVFRAYIQDRRRRVATALERANRGGATAEQIESLRGMAAMLDGEL